MTGRIAATLLSLLACGTAHSQSADTRMTFEVASVKPSPPRKEGEPRGTVGCLGGPGSRDPIRFTCSQASVSLMALYAYGLKPYELRPPASADTRQFNIEANVAPGTTAEQVKSMLRNLLTERFKLAFHREKADVQGYALVIAKSGLKMKESIPDPPPLSGPIKDPDGFVYIPMRNALAVGRANGLTRWVGNNVPVDTEARSAHLTGLLASLTGRPVIDETGLRGKYDFTLTFSEGFGESVAAASADGATIPDGDGGLTVFGALEKQLGLKLDSKKIVIDLFVIDHAEKNPVEN